MNPNELYHEKEHLITAAIKKRFNGLEGARYVARVNNMDLEDLFQVGSLVLWRLCQKYDPSQDKTFNSYVLQTIQWRIIDELHIKGLPIRIPNTVSWKKRQAFSFHSTDLHTDDGEETNDYFAVSTDNVEEMAINRIRIKEAFSQLEDRERWILIHKSRGSSDVEVGRMFNRSASYVSSVKRKAIKKAVSCN